MSDWQLILLFLGAALSLAFWLERRTLKHRPWRRRSNNPYELRDLQEELHRRREQEED